MSRKKLWVVILAVCILLTGAYFWGSETEQQLAPLPTALPTATITDVSPSAEPQTPAEVTIPTKPTATQAPSALPETIILEEAKEETEQKKAELVCTLTVRCDDVLQNMDKLSKGKEALIPENGMIFPKEQISFSLGESVFDVLLRVLKERGIHMEFVNTPMYNSTYVEGIGNLYEFDCGDTSGWTYTVNGESPMHGSSQHPVQQGDNIEFVYRCSLYGG